jgi:hypothetical protein
MIAHNINIWPDRESRSGGLETSRSNGIPLARGDLSVSQERETRPRPLTMDGQSRLRAGPRFDDTGPPGCFERFRNAAHYRGCGPPEGSVTLNSVQGLRCRNRFDMAGYVGNSPPSSHDRARESIWDEGGMRRDISSVWKCNAMNYAQHKRSLFSVCAMRKSFFGGAKSKDSPRPFVTPSFSSFAKRKVPSAA